MSQTVDPGDDASSPGSGAAKPGPTKRAGTLAALAAAAPNADKFFAAVAVHAVFIAVWQIVADLPSIPAYLLPSPLETFATLSVESNDWVGNTLVTATEIVGGFLLAAVIGVLLALFFSWSRILLTFGMPLLITLNMVPKVALGPIIIVWMNYGVFTNTVIAFTICFFPIVITTSRGLQEVEPEMLYLARSLRASKWQIFRKIQFPSALPYIFSGMKVAAVLAVAGAIVGEFIGSDKGLGYLMTQVQINLDTATMFMAVILISLIGVALYAVVALLEWLLVHRGGQA